MKSKIILLLLAIIVIPAVILWLGVGMLGNLDERGTVTDVVVEDYVLERRQRQQFENSIAAPNANQILFGDLNVQTSFSYDAYVDDIITKSAPHTPADACDFARYCSSLDFWASTDSAESLTSEHWRELRQSVSECNAVADPKNPDTVAFLGWQWSQVGTTADNHYGHKNVILKDPVGKTTPNRPIAAPSNIASVNKPTQMDLAKLSYEKQASRYLDWARFIYSSALPECTSDLSADVGAADCREYAATPAELFNKLDQWQQDVLVIPNSTSWGLYTPPGANWRNQLSQHDPDKERLLEIYSSYGSSEEYMNNAAINYDDDGQPICPAPTAQYTPGCYKAGYIIYKRCISEDLPHNQCRQRELKAQQNYLRAGIGGHLVLEDAINDEWLEAGQCNDCFLPAFNHRPNSSAQAILATRSNGDSQGKRQQFNFGFIASGANHQARPGTGYKEAGRGIMSPLLKDEQAKFDRLFGKRAPYPKPLMLESTSVKPQEVNALGINAYETERAGSFAYTGGLVAVHSQNRSRDAIWQALEDKQVYGTSGPRILLWFDLLDDAGFEAANMGQSIMQTTAPVFRAKAIGSFKPKPGCPAIPENAMGEQRAASLCQGECYNPSNERKLITRLEVVRILPQNTASEDIAPLIQDPWLVHNCEPNSQGCSVDFTDPDYATLGRDAAYYVRAIEEATPTINGAGQQCDLDSNGQCLTIVDCGVKGSSSDDCLAPVEHRAWSSPIFINYN